MYEGDGRMRELGRRAGIGARIAFAVAAAFAGLVLSPAGAQPAATAPLAAPLPDNAPAPPPVAPAPVAAPVLPPERGIVVPARPTEARAAKAYTVFEANCARCHQTGKTENPLASGSIANILAIDELARDSLVVRPGIPDASPLYDILVSRHAPLEIYADGPDAIEPQPDDIQAVREWIRDLDPKVQTCADRAPVKPEERDAMMREAQRLERDGAKDLRFVSLIHLYNACVPIADIAAYGQALTKLFNSLSWTPEPARLTPLDATGTLFSVKLSDFGWVSGHWDLIQRDSPKLPELTIPADIKKAAGTALPFVHGDWLAAAASEPPLYYALLGLPSKLTELEQMVGVDVDQSISTGAARRITVRQSAITRGNRLMERHAGKYGPMWLVYDFATSSGEQDLFARPLGPKATPSIKTPFKPDEIRAAFALPNGFFGYAVFDGAGNRVDRVLPGIEKAYAGTESNALEPVTKPGANCFVCHVSGIRVSKDDFRPHVAAVAAMHAAAEAAAAAAAAVQPAATAPDTAPPAQVNTQAPPAPAPAATLPPMLPRDITDSALAMQSNDSETALLTTGDNERFRAAQVSARIEPDLRVKGEEIVSALARSYRGGSDVKAAVAQAGLDRDAFMKTLSETQGPAAALARRLQQGVLPRSDLDRLFALLRGIDKPQAPQGTGGFLREVKSEIGLSVWIDKLVPSAGDLVTIKAEADTDCFLTLISIDAEGKGTVLFPNDFEKDNLIRSGKTIAIPAPDARYQLRFKADGTEMLIGRCSTSATPPTGIEHDYVRQRFTVLGNWENFIEDTLVTEAEMRRSPEKAARARTAKAQAAQRQRDQSVAVQRPNTSPGVALRDGRAVVVIGRD